MEYIIVVITVLVVSVFAIYGIRAYLYVHSGEYDTDNRLDSVSK